MTNLSVVLDSHTFHRVSITRHVHINILVPYIYSQHCQTLCPDIGIVKAYHAESACTDLEINITLHA